MVSVCIVMLLPVTFGSSNWSASITPMALFGFNFVNSTAPNFGRVVSADKISVRGTESIGKQSAQTRLFTNT